MNFAVPLTKNKSFWFSLPIVDVVFCWCHSGSGTLVEHTSISFAAGVSIVMVGMGSDGYAPSSSHL